MDLKSSRTYQQLINFLARLELTLATAFAFPSLSSSNIFCEKKYRSKQLASVEKVKKSFFKHDYLETGCIH